MNRLNALGLGLIVVGVILAPFCYLVIYSIPLTVLGIALAIIGIVMLLTPQHLIPHQVVKALITGSINNIEAILEEFNASHFFPGFKTHDFVCKKPMELAITKEDRKFVITNSELDAIGLGNSVIEALADFMENMIDQYKLLKEFYNENRLTQYAERLFTKYKDYLKER